MAYVDTSSNTRRTATAITVAAIQAGMIYAVATGLAVKFMPPPNPADPPDAINVPLDPMPIPEDPKPKPLPDPRNTHERAPLPHPADPTPNPRPTGQATEGAGPIAGTGPGDGEVLILDPPEPPPPIFTPHMAKPRNTPSSWATTNDYPASDMRQGHQGLTRFRLSIGADGRVTDCETITSSGFSSLDRATCEKVIRRARFDPATDSSGNTVPGSYSGSIRWQIPD